MMGTIQGHNVYRVAKVSIIAYHVNPNAALNEQQRKDEATYLRVVDSLLNDRVSTQRHLLRIEIVIEISGSLILFLCAARTFTSRTRST